MTVNVLDYYKTTKLDRKKEPRYLAVINKNNCTSCNACATMCPVDCIYEVEGGPSESYHVVDTARCIGCQLCYRIPTQSTEHYTLEICPWNAIDMLHNPNAEKQNSDPVLMPYYTGSAENVPWSKLEEYGYQLYLNEHVRIWADAENLNETLAYFNAPDWSWGDGNFSTVYGPENDGEYLVYRTTPEGQAMLDTVFQPYPKIFLD